MIYGLEFLFVSNCPLAVKHCGCLGFLTQVCVWCLCVIPERALVMWGVSFRPVHMTKQESGERWSADKSHTHPGRCWWLRQNKSHLRVAEKACSRNSWKAKKGMLFTCRVAHWSHCVFILSDTRSNFFCCRFYVGIFTLLVCLHSYCDRGMITFQTFKVGISVSKAIHKLPHSHWLSVYFVCIWVFRI